MRTLDSNEAATLVEASGGTLRMKRKKGRLPRPNHDAPRRPLSPMETLAQMQLDFVTDSPIATVGGEK